MKLSDLQARVVAFDIPEVVERPNYKSREDLPSRNRKQYMLEYAKLWRAENREHLRQYMRAYRKRT